MIEMRPVDFTNDTHVIRTFSRMTAINSAIEVDLTGQVVADSIGHRMYSGVGGQMDFIRGRGAGQRGPGDHRPPVDRRRRARSRGSSASSRPGPASSRPAPTRGRSSPSTGWRSCSARASANGPRALIAIADPAFRDELTAAARTYAEL